jgi:MFS family permease
MRYRDLFRDSEFRALFVADVLSISGSYLARVAVAGLVYGRTGSAALTALAFAIGFVPFLLSPWLAALADLFPRRILLILADCARGVCVGLILIPDLPLGVMMALLFLESTWRIPWGAARLALLTDILSREAFPAANALIASVRQALQVGGFAVGGLVVALIGVRPALAFDTVSYFVSALMVFFLVRPREAPWRTRHELTSAEHGDSASGSPLVRPTTWASTVEGLRTVAGNPRMVRLFALLGLGPAIAVITEALAVPLADLLGGGLRLAGLIMAAPPLGTVVGLFLLGRVPMTIQRRLLPSLAIGTGVTMVLAGVATELPRGDLLVLVVLFVCGGCVSYISTIQSEISSMVESGLRGRIFGLANATLQLSQGLAIVLAGLIAISGELALAIVVIAALFTGIIAVVLGLRPRLLDPAWNTSPA